MSAIAYAAPPRRATVRFSLGVLWHALVLLGRHWPTLLAFAFLGSAGHDLLLWAAVRASRVSSALGVVVLVLVPLALVATLVFMMRALRPSLPFLNHSAVADGDRRGLFVVFGSVAVPFLTIYSTYDYMRKDFSEFTYEVWRDSDPGTTMSRLPFNPTLSIIAIIIIAIVLRSALGYINVSFLLPLTLPVGAYVEVVWLATATMVGQVAKGAGWDWLDSRRAGEWWHGFWDHLTPVLQPVRMVLEALWHNIDVVVLAPIAWLALGAVVYGRQLTERRLTDERTATSAIRWARRLPGPLSFLATSFGGALYTRFSPLINGLRMLGRAGLRPMLVFCVAFVILQFVPEGLWEIERFLIGPHDLEKFWMPLSYLTAPVNVAIRFVLIVCLVAAATDRILAADNQPAAAESTVDATSGVRTEEARSPA
jgi:hypothetical protein